jgi:D-alanyl-lipoteichoic acid acyltransferase DltB (MBOAT superfamily)
LRPSSGNDLPEAALQHIAFLVGAAIIASVVIVLAMGLIGDWAAPSLGLLSMDLPPISLAAGSPAFVLACCALPVTFQLAPHRRLRQVLLTVFNIVFLTTLIPDQASWICLAGIIVITYGMLLVVKTSTPRGHVLLAVAYVLVGYMFFKKYPLPFAWLRPCLDDAVYDELIKLDAWRQPLILVGISYMLFKFIHVLVDRWQGQLDSISLASYANYQLSFFTVMAGPIQRYNDFCRGWQAIGARPSNTEEALVAWRRILTGTLKLGAVAPLLWKLFETAGARLESPAASDVLLWFAAYFYAYPFYLYFNFSGYCDSVIGCAGLLGFRVPENFNRPFLARNLIDYWDRWHITLTHWIRDYVFMSSYKAAAQRYPAWARPFGYGLIFFALFLAGIWHGVGAGFAVFGVLHGLGAAISRAYGDALRVSLGRDRMRRYLQSPLIRAVAVVVTFHFVCFSMLFFASGLERSVTLLRTVFNCVVSGDSLRVSLPTPLGIAVVFAPAVLFCALVGSDRLLEIVDRVGQRIAGNRTLGYLSLSAKAFLVVLAYWLTWALGAEEPVVVYMRF